MVVAYPGRLLSSFAVGGGRYVVPDYADDLVLAQFGQYVLPLGIVDPEEPPRPIIEAVTEGVTQTTALSIPTPNGLKVGDNVLLVCGYSGSGSGFGTLGGTTKIVDVTRGTGGRLQCFWANINSASDIPAVSYALTASSTGNHMGFALRISGAANAAPTTATASNGSAVSPQTSPFSAAAWDNSLIIRAITGSRSVSPMTWVAPTGAETVEFAEVGAGPVTSTLVVQERVPIPPDIRPAATGPNKSWTPVVAAAYASGTVTIAPAVNPPQTLAATDPGTSTTSGDLSVQLRTDSLVTQIGTPTSVGTFTTNSNLNLPRVAAATQVGDLLIAVTSYRNDDIGYQNPGDWTLFAQESLGAGGAMLAQIWTKRVVVSEPNSYLFASTKASQTQFGMMMAFRGVTTIDAFAWNDPGPTNATVTTPTPTTTKQWTRNVRGAVLYENQIRTTTATWTGATEIFDAGHTGNSFSGVTVATHVQQNTGAMASSTAALTNAINWVAFSMALAGD